MSVPNIAILNPETQEYENPTGVDNVITALFDAQFVYSDLDNEEFRDFGKTKIVGKLISEVAGDFQKTEQWKQFESVHKQTFGENGLLNILKGTQEQIQNVLSDQYGETTVEFNFGIPTIENFLKTGEIILGDNGIKTNVSEKGTGMQRALALSLIQVYAEIVKKKGVISKPIFFFLDEPETFLHPHAQDKLLCSLDSLAQKNQVFLTTHSPYLLRNYKSSNSTLKVLSRANGEVCITEGKDLNLFPHSPTWGEINYVAFNIASVEFHIEVFDALHRKAKETNQRYESNSKTVGKSLASFDDWLFEQVGVQHTDRNHQNQSPNSNCVDKTMPVYIRNYIDHPGDSENPETVRMEPCIDEIRSSIECMLELLKQI